MDDLLRLLAVEEVRVVGLLLLVIVAFWREWIVTGAAHRRVVVERDEWRDLVLQGLSLGEAAVSNLERKRRGR